MSHSRISRGRLSHRRLSYRKQYRRRSSHRRIIPWKGYSMGNHLMGVCPIETSPTGVKFVAGSLVVVVPYMIVNPTRGCATHYLLSAHAIQSMITLCKITLQECCARDFRQAYLMLMTPLFPQPVAWLLTFYDAAVFSSTASLAPTGRLQQTMMTSLAAVQNKIALIPVSLVAHRYKSN